MALGMLLVIVAGHIDLSVGSIVGFVGAVAAMLMVQLKVHYRPGDHAVAAASARRSARRRAISSPISKIPSFIVTLAGMLIFRGLTGNCCWASPSAPSRNQFQKPQLGLYPRLFGRGQASR